MVERSDAIAEKEISFRDYLEILSSRRMSFIIGFSVVLIVSLLYTFFIKPLTYKAEATVIIGPPAVQIVTEHGWMIRESYRVSDELEFIKSSELLERASQMMRQAEGPDSYIAASAIRSMLKLSHRQKSNIVDIAAVSTDPRAAYLVVKYIVEAYIEEGESRRQEAIKKSYDSLNVELAKKHKEIEEAERKLTKFVIEHEIIARGLEVGRDAEGKEEKFIEWKEPEINEKYLALKSKRINKEAFLEEIKSHRKGDEISALSVIAKKDDSLIDTSLRDELYKKESNLSKLLLTQNELHPNVIEARGEVEEAKKKITREIDRAIQSLETSIATLKREEDKLKTLIEEGLSETMVAYAALQRDVAVKKGIYDKFISQLQILDVSEKLQDIPFLEITKEPTLPDRPMANRARGILLAFLSALTVGVVAVFTAESIDISIGNVEEVEDLMGLTILASIPKWEKKLEGESDQIHRGTFDIGLATVRHPQSIIGEAFRTLRTNIKFVTAGKDVKSFVVTSAGPKEGKSVISTNLAVAMANAGENVILVDGDMRRPKVHKYFNIDNTKGLSNLLIDEKVKDIETHNTEFKNLKVIPSGPIPPNPNELLGGSRMKELLLKLKERFDIIIIDSPPVLSVSDSLILGTKTDGAILVFSANKTAKKAGQRANISVKNAGINILGAVLNGVKTHKGGYYYYEYSYYTDEKKNNAKT
jgi:capsular exopolysaccharide synthesis family protein